MSSLSFAKKLNSKGIDRNAIKLEITSPDEMTENSRFPLP